MEQAQPSKLLIVDGHAYAYRAFHAIRQLSAPDGAPTNAIFGFIKMTDRMRAAIEPTHMVVVWDGGLAEERVAEHPGYKAQRPPMPADLGSQIDQIGEYLAAAGIPSFCADAVEADDWIGSLALDLGPQVPVVIASSDKDFMQLVSPQVGLLNPSDKTDRVWTSDDVVAKSGVLPGQIVDWLSLIGDSVDNIPGVPGVGPKTASDLLRQFGTIDRIYTGLENVKSERLRESLKAAHDIVMRNRRLIGLKRAGGATTLESLRLAEPKTDVLRELFGRWGFKTMKADLDARATMQQVLF